MVSSSSLIFPPMFSVVAKLAGEFPSLEEPTMILTLRLSWFCLPTDPISSNLRSELNPKVQRESLGFRSSDPSPNPGLRRLT
jgi:hypothetical protein